MILDTASSDLFRDIVAALDEAGVPRLSVGLLGLVRWLADRRRARGVPRASDAGGRFSSRQGHDP